MLRPTAPYLLPCCAPSPCYAPLPRYAPSPGDINYAEFAALMTSDDILAMGGGQRRRNKKKHVVREEFRLFPGGPTEQELRKGQMMLRERINSKYNSLTAAFRTIDNDHSGRLGERA